MKVDVRFVKEVVKRYLERIEGEEYRNIFARIVEVERKLRRAYADIVNKVILPALTEEELTARAPWRLIYDRLEEGYVESDDEARRILLRKYGSAKKAVKALLKEHVAEGVGDFDILYHILREMYVEKGGDERKLEEGERKVKELEEERRRLEEEKCAIAPFRRFDVVTLEGLVALIAVVHGIIEDVEKEQRREG